MKKNLLPILMLSAMLPSFAGEVSRIPVSPEAAKNSHREFVVQNNILPRKSKAAKSGENQVILTPPADAEVTMYTRKTLGYSVRWGQAYQEFDEGIVGEIAYCQNGDVYLKNPLSFYATDSWIKGTKKGNTLTFTFPQLLASVPADDGVEDGEVMEVWVNVLKSGVDDNSIFYEFDENIPNEITMTIDDEGNIIYSEEVSTETVGGMNYTLPAKMMALTNSDKTWLGYADYDNVYKPFTTEPTLIPEDLETLEYSMTFGDSEINGKWVKVAFDEKNSKMYIAGIYTPSDKGYEGLVNNAIVGDYFDGGAMFKSRQYVGIDPYYYHAYISGVISDGQYLDIQDTYFLTTDSKKSKYTASCSMAVSEGENQGYVLDVFYYPIFDAQDGYVDPNPAEPLVTGFMPYTPQYGYGGVKVQIPNTNKNGQLLHEENLSYSIIINGNQIIFDPEAYPEFTEATPWIPFEMSSYNVEIDPFTVNTRMVFMTDELLNVHTISVQSRYKDNDTYYVTNGQTYVYKLPQLDDPTFDPETGYEFVGDGEVKIISPAGSIVSYRIISDDDGSPEFIDADASIVSLEINRNCFIQAMSKDPEGDDERTSNVVTATYTVVDSSVKSIIDEFGDDVEIYTVGGVRVNQETLKPGLYIIKSGKASRVMVK